MDIIECIVTTAVCITLGAALLAFSWWWPSLGIGICIGLAFGAIIARALCDWW